MVFARVNKRKKNLSWKDKNGVDLNFAI